MADRKSQRDEARDAVAERGRHLFLRRVAPSLGAEHRGQFVAIDTLTGDYEVDADDITAVRRLRGRRPGGEFWLERAGFQTAYEMRGIRECH